MALEQSPQKKVHCTVEEGAGCSSESAQPAPKKLHLSSCSVSSSGENLDADGDGEDDDAAEMKWVEEEIEGYLRKEKLLQTSDPSSQPWDHQVADQAEEDTFVNNLEQEFLDHTLYKDQRNALEEMTTSADQMTLPRPELVHCNDLFSQQLDFDAVKKWVNDAILEFETSDDEVAPPPESLDSLDTPYEGNCPAVAELVELETLPKLEAQDDPKFWIPGGNIQCSKEGQENCPIVID